MSDLQLVTVTPNKLTELINHSLKELLNEFKKDLKEEFEDRILSRVETAKLLQINTSTLSKWTSQGVLSSYGIGGRIYYKRSDIDNALIKLT